MADHPIRTAAAAENGLVEGTLLEAIVKRTIYTINVGELWTDLDQPVGDIVLAIFDAATGYVYSYDATDSTSPDDGLTVRVDGSGHRYVIEDAASISISTVLAEQNAPPGSPTVGDSYIVGSAPSGAWAAHATDIAIYTRRGWVFAVPEIGMTVFDQGAGANKQFDESGAWVNFAITIADGSVRPSQLQFAGGLSVESQQNAPPAATVGPYYVVGTAGSGAWSGHNNELAYSTDGSAWSFVTPYDGLTVYNKATDLPMRYNAGAWTNIPAGIIDRQVFTTPGAATWTKPTGLPANAMALVEGWGSGASGGGGNASAALGGGGASGGAYEMLWVLASLLGSTEAVTVAAGAVVNTAGSDGLDGSASSFGSWLTALGGRKGLSANNGANGGTGRQNSDGIAGFDGGDGGNGGSVNGAVGESVKRGGGGGTGGGTATTAGGDSLIGGDGGAGAGSNANGSAGSAPGGGGGGGGRGSGSSTGGAGARGEVRVTIFA